MAGKRPRAPLKLWLQLTAALLVLNFAVTFHNVWPTPWIAWRNELSIEIAVLILVLAACSAWWRPPPRLLITFATVGMLLLCLGRYADVTTPALYGRTVNIYWDAQHLPAVLGMLGNVASPALIVAIVSGVIVFMTLLYLALRWCLLRVWDALEFAATRRAMAVLGAGLTGLYVVSAASPLQTFYWFSLPVTATYAHQAKFVLEALDESKHGGHLPPAAQLPDSDLQQVAGTDVFVVFLESYGAVTFDVPAVARIVDPSRARLAAAIAKTGRSAVSAFVTSPTFGGSSWLAHISLLTGTQVADAGTYNLLMTQRRDTLLRRFARGGHRVVALMPGLRSEWPEGAFYGFDAIYGAPALDYRGPAYGWWRIPDQYSLAKLDGLEMERRPRAPLFVFFPTISTHMPFAPTPPYQPDWGRFATGEPYAGAGVAASLDRRTQWMNLQPAYADTVAYAFAVLGGYLEQHASTDILLILLGDHQPAATVSGEGVRWDVPVHIITSRQPILNALIDAGFTPGLAPHPAPIASMHELTPLLLRSLDSHAARAGGLALHGPLR